MIYLLGDIMLDEWVTCKITKVSPEASVPIITRQFENDNLGGVGNLAVNMSNLEMKFCLISVIGDDLIGKKIQKLLKVKNIQNNLQVSKNNNSTLKRRYIDQNGHHIIREDKDIDKEKIKISDVFINKIKKNDFVVISDYAKGFITKKLIVSILKKTKKVFVDPKNASDYYKGVFFIKPNLKEISNWISKYSNKEVKKLLKTNKWKWILVTKSDQGIDIYNQDKVKSINSSKIEVTDVAGAGDLVFAIMVYYFVNNLNPFTGAEIADKIARQKIKLSGICQVNKSDLIHSVVWTNGVFDILHLGHLKLLNFAKKQGTKLIVGLNSDKSVKLNKGSGRPINNLSIRKKQIEELGIADQIVVFNEKTPIKLINKIKPDIIVKGSDYKKSQVVGSNISKVLIFKLIKNQSTSSIIKKIQ